MLVKWDLGVFRQPNHRDNNLFMLIIIQVGVQQVWFSLDYPEYKKQALYIACIFNEINCAVHKNQSSKIFKKIQHISSFSPSYWKKQACVFHENSETCGIRNMFYDTKVSKQ